jgi:hypothetical protein
VLAAIGEGDDVVVSRRYTATDATVAYSANTAAMVNNTGQNSRRYGAVVIFADPFRN